MPDTVYTGNVNMPYSAEAEQALLGCLLTDHACLELILSRGFSTEYFFMPQHKAIYNALLRLDANGESTDPVLVMEQLKAGNIMDEKAARTYLAQLANAIPSTANVESYAKIVKDKFMKRTLIERCNEILGEVTGEEEDADLLLDSAEQKIYDIRQGKSSAEASRVGEVIVDKVYDRLAKLNSDEREKYLGVPTGFSKLDSMISGLNRSDLIIVGARPAMGKTSFALNVARNVAVNSGRKVLFFSLEMSKEQLAQRVVSMEARIEGVKMRNGKLEDKDWERLAVATESLSTAPLYLDDKSDITVNEMKARIRRLHNVECVIVDYLQLMKSGTKTDSRVQEVSEITRNLKLMAKDLEVPVMVLAQLSRGTERGSKSHRPQLSDLRESGSIEQDADIVLMLFREDYYADGSENEEDMDVKQVDKVEVIVSKNRHGPTGSVDLGWDDKFTLFRTIDEDRDNVGF
ncbi:MAG: replicative DNA helicase [Clostridia bacterium]|nr:replicative DNA helicase [Clostridia bacterium]